jgi:hypothetical protein
VNDAPRLAHLRHFLLVLQDDAHELFLSCYRSTLTGVTAPRWPLVCTTYIRRATVGYAGAMHRSRLAGFIIDCQTNDLGAAAAFWGPALGLESLGAQDERYIRLDGREHGLTIEVQTVAHPSRVHLDIEADDVEAEVARLESLGARRLEKIRTWWVLEAPTGQRFCVVQAKSPLEGRPGTRSWR